MSVEHQDGATGSRAGGAPLDHALVLCAECAWQEAYELLRAADERGALDGPGLELLADCARWVGDTACVISALEKAHHAQASDPVAALRTALALCYTHMDVCETSVAATWWQRCDGLIADLPEGPAHGLHAWFACRASGDVGDLRGQEQHATRALEIAQRHGDRNVEALALVDLAHVATSRGESAQAQNLVNRATAMALGGEIGVLETGLVYCNAIVSCRSRGEWDRAQALTNSADRWVARTRVSYFPGLCRVHRAEVLRVRGELEAAETEVLEALRLLASSMPRWLAVGYRELGEIRRRRGDTEGALRAFQEARSAGWDPQPGEALLRMAQGDAAGAHRLLARFCSSPVPTLLSEDRVSILRAQVTIALAAGDPDAAAEAQGELAVIADGDGVPWDHAAAMQARGELAWATGNKAAAIDDLQEARARWAALDAPFELASCGLMLGRALLAQGEAFAGRSELEAARRTFDRIGAQQAAAEATAALGGESPAASPAPPAGGEASLCREGEFWTITFGGATQRLKDGKGPQYLACLLGDPGSEQLALELAGGGEVAGGDAGELLDREARQAYRLRLGELQAELDEATGHADIGRQEQLRTELDLLTRQLACAVGLSGRARRAGDPHERARQRVTKALRLAIRKLAATDADLGRYLGNTIRTGTTCCFDPDPGRPIRWDVRP